MPPSVVCPPRRSRNSRTSVFAPCRAAAMPAGAPPVPPPATTTSYDARTGSGCGNGAASPMRPRRSAALPAARPTAAASVPFSAHGPTTKMPSGSEVNVSGVAYAILSAASAWSAVQVRSRAICSAARNENAEPSANGSINSCTCILPARSTTVNVQGLSPDGNGRREPPARSARRPRTVASISTFARTDWKPLRDATTTPAKFPFGSRRMSVAGKPVRNGTPAASMDLSSPRLTRNGVTLSRNPLGTGPRTRRTPGSWRG